MRKQEGTDAFIERLCAEQYAYVLRYLFYMLGEESAARDVTQEVFLTACKKSGMLTAHPNPGGWLFQTAKNLAKKHKRETCRRLARETVPDGGEGLPDQAGAPEAALDRRVDETKYVEQVLRALTPEKRSLYTLYYLDGLSMRQIAAQMGMDEAAVRMRFVRLRREMKQLASQVAERNFDF